MKKHKFALIGCGRISYKHINAISKIENAELTAVCDLKEERAKKKGEENNISWYTDYHKMLKHEDIDIVNILVESGKHAEVFKDIIHYKKHVIIEKPMALTLSDADDMIKIGDEAGIKMFIVTQSLLQILLAPVQLA